MSPKTRSGSKRTYSCKLPNGATVSRESNAVLTHVLVSFLDDDTRVRRGDGHLGHDVKRRYSVKGWFPSREAAVTFANKQRLTKKRAGLSIFEAKAVS